MQHLQQEEEMRRMQVQTAEAERLFNVRHVTPNLATDQKLKPDQSHTETLLSPYYSSGSSGAAHQAARGEGGAASGASAAAQPPQECLS